MSVVVESKSAVLHRMWLAIFLLSNASAVWLVFTILSDWPLAYFLVGVLVWVAALPLLSAYARGRFDFFEPITGISLLYVVYFGVAAVYRLNVPFGRDSLGIDLESGVVIGLSYAVLALLALQAGYRLAGRFGRAAPAASYVETERWSRVFWVALAVWAVGVGARLYGVTRGFHIRFAASGTYGQFSGVDILYDYLGFFSTLGFIVMAAFSCMAPRPLAARVLSWGLMLPFELFFALLGGPKETFVPILFAPLICYHYGRRSVSTLKVLVPACVMGLLVFPVMTSYRMLDPLYLRQVPLWDGVAYAVGGVRDLLSQQDFREYVRWGGELVVGRLNGITTLSGVLMNVPNTMEFQAGKTIVLGFAMLVPTFIWSGKNDYLSTVITWGDHIFGVPVGGGGISITQPGELFLNFGTPGVIIGMFLLGAGFRTLHRWMVGDRRFFGVVSYAALWPIFVIPEYPIGAYYSNGVKQAVIIWLVSVLAGSRWTRPVGPARRVRP